MWTDTVTRDQASKSAHYLHVKQMWNDERVAAGGDLAPERIGQYTIGEEFNDYGRVQNNHRASRSSRMICAPLFPIRIGFARRVSSNHSRTVGSSTVRSNSLFI